MSILTILLIALGLAMDSFAVAICKGLSSIDIPKTLVRQWGNILLMAVLFGGFQGLMPLIGYYAGNIFAGFVSQFAPWIVLILLSIIGGKMIYESRHESCESNSADFSLLTLVSLAIATSMDAMATGVIFVPVPHVLWQGVIIIGVVSFVMSLAGYWMGKVLGRTLPFNVEMIGGIVLILIGLKIFIEGIFL